MAFDPKAIAVNWARSDEKRKRQEEERQEPVREFASRRRKSLLAKNLL